MYLPIVKAIDIHKVQGNCHSSGLYLPLLAFTVLAMSDHRTYLVVQDKQSCHPFDDKQNLALLSLTTRSFEIQLKCS